MTEKVENMDYQISDLELAQKANQIRQHVIRMIGEAGSGHPGGSLSAADICTVLYFDTMHIDPKQPNMPDRDRFVLSKGHAAPVLYATLAERGYFDTTQLMTLRKLGSSLQGHPDMRKVVGVEMSTGSLGQGLSVACGMAYASKLDQRNNYTYALLGDGEIQEGQIWEAAMFAAHYQLGHLIAFLDYNHLQIDGRIEDVMNPSPLPEKWQAFGWHVQEIDGHNLAEIRQAIALAQAEVNKPSMIIAQTVKGKGVSFMENQAGWHGSAPSQEQVAQAIKELQAGGKADE